MSLSLVTPVTLTVASFTSVIFPSRLIVTSGSRLASIRLRAYADVRFCPDISRMIFAIPTIMPFSFFIGDMLRDTSIILSSLRFLSVSKCSIRAPERNF